MADHALPHQPAVFGQMPIFKKGAELMAQWNRYYKQRAIDSSMRMMRLRRHRSLQMSRLGCA